MAYSVTPEDLQAIRYELNDNSPGLYILDDSTISYYLVKNQGSIARTTVDCAKAILFRLSMDSKDSTIDVLSIKTSKQAEAYRLSLELFLRNPSLNPLIANASVWAGNISKSEMCENNRNPDNNIPGLSVIDCCVPSQNPFEVWYERIYQISRGFNLSEWYSG